jgi:hyaluronan synthase
VEKIPMFNTSRETVVDRDNPPAHYKYLRRRKHKRVSVAVVIFFLATFVGIVAYKAVTLEFLGSQNLAREYAIILAYTVISSVVVLIRFPMAIRYDPTKYLPIKYEPTVSIVIPAYNEEDIIADTIRDALATDYPREKFEVIVVNDGSKDRTGEIVREIGARNSQVVFIDSKANLGKREALYLGFTRARGEVVVTIDSDTSIDPDCVREIVKPFYDKTVGGVCGHTQIKNKENFYGKIQESNYFIGFHLYKKAESLFNSVFCLSGCASAYRRSIVLGFLEEWRNQHFLGQRCTFGEDRGLTTLMLKSKAKIIYTPAALAATHAPDSFRKLWKQRLRWRRSFFRETFWQAKFLFRKRPLGASLMFYTYSAMTFVTPFLSFYYMILLPIISHSLLPTLVYLLGLFLVSVLYTFYAKIYTTFPAYWTIGWWMFNTFVLSWGSIYAWMTLTNQRWLTR